MNDIDAFMGRAEELATAATIKMPASTDDLECLLRGAAIALSRTVDPFLRAIGETMDRAADSAGACCSLDCREHAALTRAAMLALTGGIEAPPNAALDDAMHHIWLHGRWRDLTTRMGSDERDAAASAVERVWATMGDSPEDVSAHELRWWADPYAEIREAATAVATLADTKRLPPELAGAVARLAASVANLNKTAN